MSPTMFLGRVVLPAIGLLVAVSVTWHSFRNVTAHTEVKSVGEPGTSAARVSVKIIAEGRVVAYPGAQVTVGTEVLGTIISMPARNGGCAQRRPARRATVRRRESVASRGSSSSDRGRDGRPADTSALSVGPNISCPDFENAAACGQSARGARDRTGSPRRGQGRRRPPRSRVGQIPNQRADRWCGHRTSRGNRRDSHTRFIACHDRRSRSTASRGGSR